MTTIICLHCSGSSGRQWARLTAALAPEHAVHTPDLIGYGSDGGSSFEGGVTLDAEAARIEQVMNATRDPVILVGHSYGAAVATRVALRHPHRVAGLALFEPVLFSLILRGGDGAGHEILVTGHAIRGEVLAGRVPQAAERFVDYWSGTAAWNSMDARRRDGLCSRMGKVAQEFGALFADTLPLAAYARLTMPVLLLAGERTPEPPKAVARRLLRVLPDVTHVRIAGAGHMGPITHADDINGVIVRFVGGVDPRRRVGLAA